MLNPVLPLAQLHAAWTIHPEGAGFLICHWDNFARPVGSIVRSDARRWELMLHGAEYSFSTTRQVVRFLNSRV